eukprot:6479674-Amphidinium_carterae.1
MSVVLEVIEVVDVVLGVDEVELGVDVVNSSMNAAQTTTACNVRAKNITCIAGGLPSRNSETTTVAISSSTKRSSP